MAPIRLARVPGARCLWLSTQRATTLRVTGCPGLSSLRKNWSMRRSACCLVLPRLQDGRVSRNAWSRCARGLRKRQVAIRLILFRPRQCHLSKRVQVGFRVDESGVDVTMAEHVGNGFDRRALCQCTNGPGIAE